MTERKKYADLNNLENIALLSILKSHPELKAHIHEYFTSFFVFPQVWGNTAGGFSEPGCFAGSAMTTQITTVVEINWTGNAYYAVFFDESPAYIVSDAPKRFLEDLKRKRLLSKYEAMKCY
ncbi:MAG: hypothetical protein IKM88_07730 [Lachnospiraceae bacterium]|nr:hypothetical protein [Lachnospiraceae bacterium]MBR3734685.1 hypothetical protein [Lachnospiraceae bacterium]MBR6850104.1 hypothetical protein [Lachnospiraceae bacterium]